MPQRRSLKAGLPPGTLVNVQQGPIAPTSLKVFVYNAEQYSELDVPDVASIPEPPAGHVSWIDVDGLADTTLLQALGQRYELHPLLQEDVLNTEQRPKLDEFDDNLFLVTRMLSMEGSGATRQLRTEQVSFVLGKNHVISFQERPGDVLEPIRERIRKGTGRIRRKGPDYLLYGLLDVIVDNYFAVVEEVGDRMQQLEDAPRAKADNSYLLALQQQRSLLIRLARYVLPMRDIVGRLNTTQTPLIEKSTRRYINDVQDHTVHIVESITMFRDLLANLENTAHARINGRMAQVMRLLTVISTIFIPLTFIVGVYGMNFEYMPELRWRYGYFAIMGAMLALSVGMLLWFRRKGWL